MIDNGTIDYKTEVLRKLIHLCSLSISIIYYFITKELALSILIPMTLLSLVLDVLRYFSSRFAKFFYLVFGFMLREHEKDLKKKNLNGATYVLISATLVILLFPKVFVIPAIAVLIVGDIAAALVGRKFGRHRFLFKSLEGTFAFFVAGSIVIFLTPKLTGSATEYLIGFIAVAVGALAENVSYGWADDNLSIPLAICITMAILYTTLMPGVELILPNVPV
ncbi:MAG: dolichol kinase [Melioribacteraceae bacterium]|nr:dolichol kinase [Melioribacteraceae bacterium]